MIIITVEQQDDLYRILESLHDGIVIVDGQGYFRWVSQNYEKIVGVQASRYLGKHMAELVEEGIVSSSASLLVLKRKEPVTVYQKIFTGKELLSTGTPVFDSKGNVDKVITNCRDISELNNLKRQLEKSKTLSDRYYAELKNLRNKQLKLELEDVVHHSPLMKNTLERSLKVASFDTNVLIQGESGTGKEVIAKLIHKFSSRREGPFIQINCGAIPSNLLESELFGYEKGAFTGASQQGKIGLLEMANTGTILLDEISELPLALQVKLLRALQNQEIYRVGGTKPVRLDIRIISSSNRNLSLLVEQGSFREDLFYRLNVVPVEVPPLRERKEDITPLALYFLNKFNKQYQLSKRFLPQTTEMMVNYCWPGNVRELENLMERLCILSENDHIAPEDLPQEIRETPKNDEILAETHQVLPLREARERVEKSAIEKALAQSKSVRQAAQKLQINHATLLKKIKDYRIETEHHLYGEPKEK